MSDYEFAVLKSQNKEKWNELVENADTKDVYYTQEYCSIYEQDYDLDEINNNFCGEANLFFYGNDEEYIIMPFIKRKISRLPFFSYKEEIYDIISPYGYTGPIGKNLNKGLIVSFLEESDKYCKKNNIVAEFVRFNPLLKNQEIIQNELDILERNRTVYIELSLDKNMILSNMDRKTRNLIKKAEKNGICVEFGRREDLKKFTEIYLHRMKEKNTNKMYLFPIKFFEKTLDNLKENAFLLIAKYKGEIIAGSLFLHKYRKLHYHFSGTDPKYRNLNPTNLIIYKAALWGREHGLKIFHLGGGNSANKNDPLFHFKSGFSNTFSIFCTANRIHNPELYTMICDMKNKYDSGKGIIKKPGFFPEYRS